MARSEEDRDEEGGKGRQEAGRQEASSRRRTNSAFISSGFKNWKKALERFTVHERSDSHKTAMTTHIYEDRSVQVQLFSLSVKQQEEARGCLLKIIGAVQMLARQMLAMNVVREILNRF